MLHPTAGRPNGCPRWNGCAPVYSWWQPSSSPELDQRWWTSAAHRAALFRCGQSAPDHSWRWSSRRREIHLHHVEHAGDRAWPHLPERLAILKLRSWCNVWPGRLDHGGNCRDCGCVLCGWNVAGLGHRDLSHAQEERGLQYHQHRSAVEMQLSMLGNFLSLIL